MSRFFPHTSHAEDQPLAQTILYNHVLYRGFQTGALLGGSVATFQYIRGKSRAAATSTSLQGQTATARALARTGRWALVTTALMIPATSGRMYGREEIEWQDRSWRLLESEGQKEVDDWSLVGTVVGAAASARVKPSAVGIAGGAGIGSLVGVGGYMVWRYGVNGGKRPYLKE